MNKQEAKEWLVGERSYTNMVPREPFETWQSRIQEADAYAAQQAYWILRAYKEGLLPDEESNNAEV